MTLTKKDINRIEKSMWIKMSDAQKAAIFERFGTEPEPYEWTDEDIGVQIRSFMESGVFSKPAHGDYDYDQNLSPVADLLDDEPF